MATQRPKPSNDSHPASNDCTHHWVLPESSGDPVTGLCSRCGAEREFSHSIPSRFNRSFR